MIELDFVQSQFNSVSQIVLLMYACLVTISYSDSYPVLGQESYNPYSLIQPQNFGLITPNSLTMFQQKSKHVRCLDTRMNKRFQKIQRH